MGEYGGDIYVGHQYGGYGSTAGENYRRALSGVGEDVARAMIYYHQQHVKYDQSSQLADALSRLGVTPDGRIAPVQTDEKGKVVDKSVRPIIDPKSLQMFQAANQSQRVKATGALEALGKLGIQQLGKAMSEARSDQGLTGQLKAARIQTANTRGALNTIQAAKLLGKIPPVPPVPTAGQVMMEQRSLRKERFNQRKAIADSLGADKNLPITDPQMLLSGVQFKVPSSGAKGFFGGADLTDGVTDNSGNLIPPQGATTAVLDNGMEVPIKAFNRLHQQAQQWKALAAPLPQIITPPPHDMQTLLSDPSATRKALFDKHYGPGASDLVLSAQDTMTKQQTPTASPQDAEAAPESADEYDTSGEVDQTPPAEEPSDAGGE